MTERGPMSAFRACSRCFADRTRTEHAHVAVAIAVVLVLALLLPSAAEALPIGLLSFDLFVPGPGGINAFNILNLTGPFALPPDFPVLDALTFGGATLHLMETGGALHDIALGNLAPGPVLDAGGNPVVQFPDIMGFVSATLESTLGDVFIAVTLSHVTGGPLVPGDLAVIDTAAAVPEPAMLTLLGTGLLGAWLSRRRRAH